MQGTRGTHLVRDVLQLSQARLRRLGSRIQPCLRRFPAVALVLVLPGNDTPHMHEDEQYEHDKLT